MEGQEYNFTSQIKSCKEIYLAENIKTHDIGETINMYSPGKYQESTFKIFVSFIDPKHEPAITLSHLDNYGHDLGWTMFFEEGQEYLLCTHEKTDVDSIDIQHGFLSVYEIDSSKIKTNENFLRSLILCQDSADLKALVLDYVLTDLNVMSYILSNLSIMGAHHSAFTLEKSEKEKFYKAFTRSKNDELIPFIYPHRKMEIDSIMIKLITWEIQEVRQQRKESHPYIDILTLLDAYILNGNEIYSDCRNELWSSHGMSVSKATKNSKILSEIEYILKDHNNANNY